MGTYGKDFAAVYNDHWRNFTARLWPFLSRTVATRNRQAETWLDLCCGPGFLLRLACDNGFRASGLDISRHVLAYARENAPTAEIIRGDVRCLSLSREFDVITCMYDSLNYLTTKRDLRIVFRRVRRHITERGIFVFDVNTFEGLEDAWCRTSAIRGRNRTVIIESSFDAGKARGRCLITGFVKTGRLYRKFEEEHIQRGYRDEEVSDLLAATGFRFRGFDGSSFSRPKIRSGRMLYVCLPKAHR